MSALHPIPYFLAALQAEWERARAMFPDQEDTLSLHEWHSTISEEVGEIARELNERMLGNIDDEQMLDRLASEVVQTAAMCGRMFSTVDLLRQMKQ